jgi:hypothetical protein
MDPLVFCFWYLVNINIHAPKIKNHKHMKTNNNTGSKNEKTSTSIKVLLDCFNKFKVAGDSFASPSYQKQGLNHHDPSSCRRRSVTIQPSGFSFFFVVSDELG